MKKIRNLDDFDKELKDQLKKRLGLWNETTEESDEEDIGFNEETRN